MNLSPCPDLPLRNRLARGCLSEQGREHGPEVETRVEAVGEGPEVLASVLAEVERLVAAADHRLEVAQHGVDPCELRQLAGLSPTHDDVGVRTIGIDDAGKAPQAIA